MFLAKLILVFLALVIAGATHSAIAYTLAVLLVLLFWWPAGAISRDVPKISK